MTNEKSLEIVEMTNKEALEMMDEWSMGIITGISDKCLSKALLALQKQIPKKPNYLDDGDYAECPVCGNADFEYGINNWGCKFCCDCGQALDWSDEE